MSYQLSEINAALSRDPKAFLDECDELVVTQVMARAENADARFPEFRDSFHIVKELGPYFADGLMYYRRTYRKNG